LALKAGLWFRRGRLVMVISSLAASCCCYAENPPIPDVQFSPTTSERYRHAAHHLAECQSCNLAVEDYGDVPSHAQFVETLKQHHGRKYGFWSLIDA